MMTTRSTPERLDAAVESVLIGGRPAVDPELRALVDTAALVADALRPIPPGEEFEVRLAFRIRREGIVRRAADAVSAATRRELAHPRWLAAGAVGSAAVGVTVTAYAVWRQSRRQHAPQRLLHR